MGKALEDPGERGIRHADTNAVLTGCCAGNTDFWLRDVGGDLLHHEGLGGVPPLIKKADNR